VSGCAAPQSLVPASTRPAGGRLAGYESVGGYARAAAKTGGKHLLGLGEAGFKYVSAQVGQWRSGSWEAASARYPASQSQLHSRARADALLLGAIRACAHLAPSLLAELRPAAFCLTTSVETLCLCCMHNWIIVLLKRNVHLRGSPSSHVRHLLCQHVCISLSVASGAVVHIEADFGVWAPRESPREEAGGGGDAEVVGTVMVRDVVTRQVVAHFRAHTAPLLLLQWDGSGTLLVTASVHGHNINIFQVRHLHPPPVLHMHVCLTEPDSGFALTHPDCPFLQVFYAVIYSLSHATSTAITANDCSAPMPKPACLCIQAL
jgi:hypothetical protein